MFIRTPRLLLREFEKPDWRRVFEYQSDPIYSRFNSWDRRTEREAQNFVAKFLEWQRESPRTKFQLAVELEIERKMIGNCGIRSGPELLDAELGFELDRTYWRNGYATEAASAMLEFAFSNLRLELVRAQCITENEASARVLRRLGMVHVKSEPSSVWMKERWWSTEHYSLSRKEWRRHKSAYVP